MVLDIDDKRIAKRRWRVFGLTFVSVVLGALKWIMVIPSNSTIFTKVLMITLFVLTFAWIALFFWSATFGFFDLLRKKRSIDISGLDVKKDLSSKTAILMPVYNESSKDVFANVLAIMHDLDKLGKGKDFDVFVLSDTTNPKVWVEEEKILIEAQKLAPKGMNLYYRRRPKNIARKSGNIEDFCNRFGSLYNFMVVLDADSLMEAQVIIKMALLMEENKTTGIIQAPPVCINRNTLFARIQQFAAKVYGPIIASGLSYLQGGDSNYWGHNAIIRVKAFIECCGLPMLKGRAPFGGYILSHDFVEAALIRRGGWRAWLLTDLKGSYEESPPTMIDYAARDRRWCQGEIQHMKLLFAKNFHPISRLHFMVGIMSYLSSPLWLCFLLTGLMITLGKEFFPPVYFPEERTLFPEWPIFDRFGTIYLFIMSMAMLILPKVYGVIIYIKNNKAKDIGGMFGAIKSIFMEIFISALVAPIMMMFQSKFVWEVLTGQSIGWNTQNRSDKGTSFKEALARHVWHTALGVTAMVTIYLYVNMLFYWTLPVTLGLVLSIPVSMFTSRLSVGLWAKKNNYFVIPEESKEPVILTSAKYFDVMLDNVDKRVGVEYVVSNSFMNALHIFMLSINGPAPEISREATSMAEVKLENFINHNIALDLNRDEEIALLYNPEVLEKAHVSMVLQGRI